MARIPAGAREETLQTTRQRLLDAAAAAFGRRGIEAANINQISLAAGLAKGTVYNYFESKQALVLALVAEAGSEHAGWIAEQVRAAGDPHQRLVTFFRAGFAYVEQHLDRARFLFAALNSQQSELQAAMNQAYQPMFQAVQQDILAAGMAQGVFRPMEVVSAGALVMTIYLGTASRFDENGRLYLAPEDVADFVFHALQA